MDGILFSFIHKPTSIFGTNILECDQDFKLTNKIDMSLSIGDNIKSFLNETSTIEVTTFFAPYLYRADCFDIENPYLVVNDDHSMPVPKENLLIIANDGNESYLAIPKLLQQSYPNIFKFGC